jgi:pantoate--beta-alanine ligase
MEVQHTIAGLRRQLAHDRAKGKSVGFVPTMGALHAGHRALLERSVRDNDVTVLSIFVNPLQFGPSEDLDRYPRTLEADCHVARNAGVDHVFAPAADEMYPQGHKDVATAVHVAGLSEVLDGLSRPGHFNGVGTVVTKLFSIVGECRAYFGEKDWQQLQIVKRFTADLSLPVEVVGCAIVRDIDGLALSSRNVYLTGQERDAALSLSKALNAAVDLTETGNRSPLDLITTMTDVLAEEPLVSTEYATIVGPDMRMPSVVNKHSRLLIAAKVGQTRLIDNCGVLQQ